MAKKNLIRTIIEGGRVKHSKVARRMSHASVRAHVRDQLHTSQEESPQDRPRPAERDFADRLGPMRRWLNSQTDQLWAVVQEKIHRKFGTTADNLAAKHALGHLYGMISDLRHAHAKNRYANFVIDKEGVFRRGDTPPWKATRKQSSHRRNHTDESVFAWLKQRRPVQQGTKLFWLVGTSGTVRWTDCRQRYDCKLAPHAYHRTSPLAGKWVTFFPSPSFQQPYDLREHLYAVWRQDKEFSRADYAFWAEMTDYEQQYWLGKRW